MVIRCFQISLTVDLRINGACILGQNLSLLFRTCNPFIKVISRVIAACGKTFVANTLANFIKLLKEKHDYEVANIRNISIC